VAAVVAAATPPRAAEMRPRVEATLRPVVVTRPRGAA
jgi:hypothetical protein